LSLFKYFEPLSSFLFTLCLVDTRPPKNPSPRQWNCYFKPACGPVGCRQTVHCRFHHRYPVACSSISADNSRFYSRFTAVQKPRQLLRRLASRLCLEVKKQFPQFL
jgi:hypothetical protein